MANHLVIGASSGIGKALAEKLSAQQHNVVGTFHETPLETAGAQRFNVLTDDPASLKIPEVLDGLVYCPGNISLKPFGRFSDEDFLRDYQLQVLGAVRVLRYVMPALRKSENASVILFSSVAAQKGFPFHTLISTHKAALEGLTKALAAEFAPKIRVNCIAPSLTQTPLAGTMLDNEEKVQKMGAMNPMKRVGQPGDLASFAAYLLSPEAGWITGQVFHIDGGASAM